MANLPRPQTPLEWLRGKTRADLQAFDVSPPCAGCEGTGRDPDSSDAACAVCEGTGKAPIPRVHFPDALRFRNATGEAAERPICFVIPDPDDLRGGTRDALEHIGRNLPANERPRTPEQAATLLGGAQWDNLENFGVLSRVIRSRKPPHGRLFKLHVLIATFGAGGTTLADAWERLHVLRRLWDVRLYDMTQEEFRAFAGEVARVKNTSPLAVLDSGLLNAFIAKLAVECEELRTQLSSCGSPTPSTPGS